MFECVETNKFEFSVMDLIVHVTNFWIFTRRERWQRQIKQKKKEKKKQARVAHEIALGWLPCLNMTQKISYAVSGVSLSRL